MSGRGGVRSRRHARRALPIAAGTLAIAVAVPALHAQADTVAGTARVTVDSTARRIVVRDIGPGAPGRVLRASVGRPHVLVRAEHGSAELPRGRTFDRSVIIVGGSARVASRVHGDVVVVGGDLFLHPGAAIEGRAVAIGGGVYNSTLATVRGDRLSFRDATFDQLPSPGSDVVLGYRSIGGRPATRVWLPGRIGLRIPTYDRINGLSLTFGPEIALDTGRVRVEPLVTYRSHLGAIDGALALLATPGRRTTIAARAERTTASNEIWIRNDIVNSAIALGSGIDVRNYYRTDRVQATVGRSWETATTIVTPFVGGAYENAWSVARGADATSAPWSFFGRDGREEGMLRANPAVSGGHIASALAGVNVSVEAASITTTTGLRIELPFSSPGDERWTQVVFDGQIAFPTFRDHRFDAFARAVGTLGDVPPTQRLSYLGGSGTIPTLALLSEGGDRLAWIESRYTIPMSFVHVPFGGVPAFTVRHVLGGAGVGSIPHLTQNLGVRLMIAMLRFDYTFDPARPSSGEFGLGVGIR